VRSDVERRLASSSRTPPRWGSRHPDAVLSRLGTSTTSASTRRCFGRPRRSSSRASTNRKKVLWGAR
jgi:hypothetical protein